MGRHAAVFAVVSLFAVSCAGGADSSTDESSAPGAEDVNGCDVVDTPAPAQLPVGEVLEHGDFGNGHTACDQGFEFSPPTSGDHFDAWQNCGFYTVPIRDYTAVHALEHGVVWVAWNPDLPAAEVAAIESAVRDDDHLLAAPYPGLKNQIVLSAWTRQVAVDRWADPSVTSFLQTFLGRVSPTAPEAGASCDGALGVPPDRPDEGFDAIFAQVRDE